MSVSIPEFWNLMLASRLASPNSLPKLQAGFSQLKGAEEEGNVATLAQWLIAQGVLSRYQAKVLLTGQPGPFIYGDYRVYDRLGSGRLQGAFRALHPATRHRVLLWFHSGPMVSNAQWWGIAVEQIALAAQVVHPHVARIYHLCDLGQFKFTALEDLQGDGVMAQLTAGPLPWAVACRMVRQAALGVARMHELRQLHGSIRPQNMWIDAEENVKLLLPPVGRDPRIVLGAIDFSAANPGEEVLRQADYLAPELAHTGYLPNPSTDIYALGCTLFHLLAGKPPFAGRDALSKLASHSSERIPSLESAGVPGPVNQVLTGMMAKDPTQRYQRPRQVAEALAQVLEKLDSSQLHRPASAVSNKLPEYEAWLQPYNLASESKTNWVPEIETPPILAASMRAEEKDPRLELLAEHAPPQSQGTPSSKLPGTSPGGGVGHAAPQTGIDIAAAFSPPVRPAVPAIAPGTTPDGALAPSPPTNRSGTTLRPQIVMPGNAPQRMAYPPDEADAIIPFSSSDMKRRKRGQRRMLLSGAVVAAFMMILLFLWLSINKKQSENPAADGTTANGAASDGATVNGATADGSKAPVETKPEENRPVDNHSDAKKPADANLPSQKDGGEKQDASPPAKSDGAEAVKQRNAFIAANDVAKESHGELGGEETGDAAGHINEVGDYDLAANLSTSAGSDGNFNSADTGESNRVADPTRPSDRAIVTEPTGTGGAQTVGTTPKATAAGGRSLWASPTNGAPLTLSYLAPGVQAVLVLRPADLLKRPDGQKVLMALGPAGVAILRNIQSLSGGRLSEIEQLTIGWIDLMDAGAEPEIFPMYVIRYSNPVAIEKLLSNWGSSSSMKNYDWEIYQAPQGLTAVMPPKEQGKVLVLGTSEAIQDVIKLAGQPPPVQRPIEKLLGTSDDKRMATLVWMPNIAAEALGQESSSSGPWQTLLAGMQRFFGEDCRSAALSAHLSDDSFFLELRVQGPLGRGPEMVVSQFKQQVAQLAGSVQDYLAGLNLDNYGKTILLRFPQMIKLLDEFTRTGTEGDQAILRCYLPAAAAQNLLLASELALSEGAAAPVASVAEATGQNSQPQNMTQKLKRVTTLSFARDTLERAIQMLADDLEIKAQIIGPDLQLEGITKNQSFGLDEKDKPADEILRIIMLKANPDGKLVYVVKPDPSGAETLWITTRAAAAKRGDTLPVELQQSPAKK
ncbi:MAG TPA: protein kinase [Pirellulales bacterium]|nr:protein kinase [Pirellulales bacterium]